MTIRELQKETRNALHAALTRPPDTEGPSSKAWIILDLLHQRMTLMEKIHDFRMHPEGPSYLDVEPDVLEKTSTTEDKEDGNGRADQHKE